MVAIRCLLKIEARRSVVHGCALAVEMQHPCGRGVGAGEGVERRPRAANTQNLMHYNQRRSMACTPTDRSAGACAQGPTGTGHGWRWRRRPAPLKGWQQGVLGSEAALHGTRV